MTSDLQREILWQAGARQAQRTATAATPVRTKLTASTTKIFGKFGIVSTVDKVLVALGVGAAMTSAGFAALMMTTDHSRPLFGGIEHLMIFAQPLRGADPAVTARVDEAPRAGIDYSATGSVRPNEAQNGQRPLEAPRLPTTEPVIGSYVVEEADLISAVVEGHGTAYRVHPGSPLPGAGHVLAIEQRNHKWVVVTTRGVILDRPPQP